MNPIIAITTTTVEDELKAKEIAKIIIDEKLAAVSQISKITSYYYIRSDFHTIDEYQVVFKHPIKVTTKIIDMITDLHPNDTPDVFSTTATTNRVFGAWCDKQCEIG